MFEQVEMNLDYKDLSNIKIALESYLQIADSSEVEECKDLLTRINLEIQKINL